MNTTGVFSIMFRFMLVIMLLSLESAAYFPDSTFMPHADSLFAQTSDTQLTSLRVKKEQHTYFMVTTCKTIPQPFSTITGRLEKVDAYPDYFSFITRVVDVNEGDGPVKMLVGGYGLYRIYFFGKIRSEVSADSSRYRVFCSNVDQKKYRKAWRKRVRGMIKIGSYSTDIFWTVEKRGDSTCRVSLTASQAFTTRTPNWMVSIGTNKIFKGMLKDLEKYLLNNATPAPAIQQAPEAAPASDSTQSIDGSAPPESTPSVSPPSEGGAAPSQSGAEAR
jgi:hypothetical protein